MERKERGMEKGEWNEEEGEGDGEGGMGWRGRRGRGGRREGANERRPFSSLPFLLGLSDLCTHSTSYYTVIHVNI